MAKENSIALEIQKKVFTIEKVEENKNEPADFEKAITATGFGKFNLMLITFAIPAGWCAMFETTTMSYVFPAAQCDLNLTLQNKGFLNAITYIGMISSAFVWGFLCDTLGRKKILFTGFFLNGFFVLMSSTSQSFELLSVAKFFGGFIVNGPFAAVIAYLSEFHCSKHRARIQMTMGIIFSGATIFLPMLGWAVLPLDIDVSLFSGYIKIHSWNIYLFICALPALLSGIAFSFLPESPKFLMTNGQNDKALKVFKTVYSMNTGKPKETYPIKVLIDEVQIKNDANKDGVQIEKNRTKVQALLGGWEQIKPLFLPPILSKIVLICLIQMLTMMSLNTIRLWLPQIFQAINDYEYLNNRTDNLCTMISVIRPKNETISEECTVNTNNSQVYINSVIVACVTMFGYVIAGTLINLVGKKRLFCTLAFFSGLCCIGIYFSINSTTALVSSSLFVAFNSIAINTVLSIVVDLFPTTLRTMAVALTMMMGRTGAMSGNLVFPLLLKTGCAPPFFSVASVIFCCSLLALLFVPNTDMKALT